MNNIKYAKTLQKLAETTLVNSGEYREYSDDALIDMTVIFNEIFLSKMYDFNKGKLSDKDMLAIATESGTEFRKLIMKYTGVDLSKAVLSSNQMQDDKKKAK